MIELRLLSDRFPGGAGMTVSAANIVRPVRVSDAAASGLLRDRRSAHNCRPQKIHQQSEISRLLRH